MDTIDKKIVGEFVAAAVHDQDKAVRLLREYPELRDASWTLGETALHFLAVEGHVDAVRFLIRSGLDVNAVNQFGDSPLIDVATLGNDEMAGVLLENGADPNAVSDTRDNVMHCAVRSGNARLVERLLVAGARPDYITNLGETVFDALPDNPSKRESVLSVLAKHGIREDVG